MLKYPRIESCSGGSNMTIGSSSLLEGSCLPEDKWSPDDFINRFVEFSLPIPGSWRYELWGRGEWIDDIGNAISDCMRKIEVPITASNYHGAVEDPLAYYVPYPSDASCSKEWGIQFRGKTMLDDFISFHSKLPRFISPDLSWRVYMMTVFWHEMAHHVIQDAWLIQEGYKNQPSSLPLSDYSGYTLMPRQDEEGFCEYMAFKAVERGVSIPRDGLRRILPGPTYDIIDFLMYLDFGNYCWTSASVPKVPLVPMGPSMMPDYFRIYALCALYKHWGRDSDPVYRPRVTATASRAVGPLWNALWDAHMHGVPVITYPDWYADLIWDWISIIDK